MQRKMLKLFWITEKAIEYNVLAFKSFVDLKKVLERVKLSDDINILKENNVSNQPIVN